jgi:hypothetical protein
LQGAELIAGLIQVAGHVHLLLQRSINRTPAYRARTNDPVADPSAFL